MQYSCVKSGKYALFYRLPHLYHEINFTVQINSYMAQMIKISSVSYSLKIEAYRLSTHIHSHQCQGLHFRKKKKKDWFNKAAE